MHGPGRRSAELLPELPLTEGPPPVERPWGLSRGRCDPGDLCRSGAVAMHLVASDVDGNSTAAHGEGELGALATVVSLSINRNELMAAAAPPGAARFVPLTRLLDTREGIGGLEGAFPALGCPMSACSGSLGAGHEDVLVDDWFCLSAAIRNLPTGGHPGPLMATRQRRVSAFRGPARTPGKGSVADPVFEPHRGRDLVGGPFVRKPTRGRNRAFLRPPHQTHGTTSNACPRSSFRAFCAHGSR